VDYDSTLEALGALAQRTRLDAFRRLVAAEPAGLSAGEIARELDVPPNTLSTHLAILTRAGLVTVERRSRQMQYRAALDRLRDLTLFLVQDCCAGSTALCGSLIAELNRS